MALITHTHEATASTIEMIEPRAQESHALRRQVPPGGYKLCMHCHETISFQPGAGRIQVTCKVFRDGALQRIELFHPECYSECNDPYGPPLG